MVGNVNNIVESMFAADNIRNQQSTATGKSGNFSDYLNMALLNSRTGLLSGSGYSFMNNGLTGFSGSIWQMAALKALRDELKRERDLDASEEAGQEESESDFRSVRKKNQDWAAIRVIHCYQSPVMEETTGKSILI